MNTRLGNVLLASSLAFGACSAGETVQPSPATIDLESELDKSDIKNAFESALQAYEETYGACPYVIADYEYSNIGAFGTQGKETLAEATPGKVTVYGEKLLSDPFFTLERIENIGLHEATHFCVVPDASELMNPFAIESNPDFVYHAVHGFSLMVRDLESGGETAFRAFEEGVAEVLAYAVNQDYETFSAEFFEMGSYMFDLLDKSGLNALDLQEFVEQNLLLEFLELAHGAPLSTSDIVFYMGEIQEARDRGIEFDRLVASGEVIPE